MTYYDSYTDCYLVGAGCELHQLTPTSHKHLTKCGNTPDNWTNEGQESKYGKLKAEGEVFISGIATNGELTAVINNNKVVEVFDRDFNRLAATVAVKRPTAVQLTATHVIISDKSGDAYRYTSALTEHTYLLGHVSVIMDMAVTRDNKLLVTCDRDEKIRISHYPNCYNIAGYLQGHTEFVIRALQFSQDQLLSIGGDDRLILWSMSEARPLCDVASPHGSYTDLSLRHVTSEEGHVISHVVAANSRHVVCYRIEEQKLIQTSDYQLDRDIIRVSCGRDKILILAAGPSLSTLDISTSGELSNCTAVGQGIDLSGVCSSMLPESKKVARNAGFTEYFERKKKRIEEETAKEESKLLVGS